MRASWTAAILVCACTSAVAAPDDDEDASSAKLADHERVDHVPTRKGVDVPVLVHETTDKPQAVLLLYPGGGGHLDITSSGLGKGADNFTVRTRADFAKAGFVAVVVDAPSDHHESLSAFRITADAADDTAKLVGWATATWKVPVWLVGTSRGTISIGNAAARGVHAHGIVLTSSVTAGAKEKSTLGDVAVANITGPVMLVHHRKDGCNASPLDGAIALKAKLVHATDVGWQEVSGGDTDRQASKCSPRSHHGYLGQDVDVVGLIADYIHKH